MDIIEFMLIAKQHFNKAIYFYFSDQTIALVAAGLAAAAGLHNKDKYFRELNCHGTRS